MHYYISKRWRLKFRRDPDAGRVLFIGPLVLSMDASSFSASGERGCVEPGKERTDPRGCWNVRCQLGKRCCRVKA